MLRLEPLGQRLPEVRSIFNRVFDKSENKYLDRYVFSENSVVGVDRRGTIQAFMLIRKYAHSHEVSYLGIMPRYQGKRYGETLLRKAQAEHSSLRLIVGHCNRRAISLYTKVGFIKRKRDYIWQNCIRVDSKHESTNHGSERSLHVCETV
jgi:ribosomal protein S18 acetylase RimI-like enzyme